MSLRRSTLLAVVGAVALLGAVIALHRLAPAVAGRLLTPLPFGLLLAAALVNHVVFALSVYLRAHRRDPFLIPSVVGAIATATAVVWTARHGSSTLVAGIYLALTVVGLVMAVTIFFDRRRRWHAEPAGSTGFS